jgi:hypothetical protein
MRSHIGVSLLALLGGCGSEDADGFFVTATWAFRSVAVNAPLDCPEGFGVVLVKTRALGGGRCNGTDVECSEAAECSVGTGLSRRLPPGVYEVSLEVTNDAQDATYATTTPEIIDLTLGDRSYARQIFVDGGVFEVAWTLRGSDGQPRSCEQAAVAGVIVSATSDADPASASSDKLGCDRLHGFSFAYPAGSYTVTLEAVNDNGQTRGLSEPMPGQLIVAPNGITALEKIDIALSSGP